MFRRPPIVKKSDGLITLQSKLIDKIPTVPHKKSKNELLRNLSEFCAKSSIHGMAYLLSERKRCLLERVCWGLAIALSFALGGLWIFGNFQDTDDEFSNRIILRQSKTPSSIDEIPFPAVSVCPVSRVDMKKFNYTEVYRSMLKLDGDNSRNVTRNEFETMKVIYQVCEYGRSSSLLNLFSDDFASDSIMDTMVDIEPNVNETFVYCRLFDKLIECNDIFFRVLSDTGYCYTFNSVRLPEHLTDQMFFNVSQAHTHNHSSTWNIDAGKYYENQKHYPISVIDAGLQFSLTAVLKTNSYDMEYLCGGTVPGFKVGFHSPFDSPTSRKNFFDLSPKHAVLYSIEPYITHTSKKMRKYAPDVRKCYFNSERKLRYYRVYTKPNCMRECLSNFTLDKCGCVYFSMPRSNESRFCGTAKLKCCRQVEKSFYNSEELHRCDCKPSCSILSYDASSSLTDFDFERTLSASISAKDFDLTNATFSRFIVTFKEEIYIPSYRVESFDWFDTLSYIGGLCGFLLGASILSIAELLYYLTIRIFFTYRENRISNNPWYVPNTFLP